MAVVHVLSLTLPDELVSIIRQQHPILDRIPFWITRSPVYSSEPHSECYHQAIQRYASPNDQVIVLKIHLEV